MSVALRRLRLDGVDLAALVEGLPVTLADAERGRLEWNTMAALLARIELRLGGPAALTDLGARAVVVGRSWARGRALGLFTSARGLYGHLAGLLPASVEVEVIDAGRDRLTCRLRAGEMVPCPQLFRLFAGMLRGVPRTRGMSEALVEAEISSHQGLFLITPPPSMTLWARLARAVQVLVSAKAMLGELEAQRSALEARLGELVVARDHAEAAARAKSQFLANMSHELRTPLNAILGTSSAMLEVSRPAAEQEDLLVLHRAAEQLLDLVTDTLAISGDHTVRREVRTQAFEILALTRTVLALSGAEDRGIEVRATVGPGVPACMRGDQGRLRRALSKIVGNAVKFGVSGGYVHLDVSVDAGVTDGVCIAVSDDGVGIPEAALPHVFDPFVQLDTTSTRAYDGAGLGLSVARELVERMGGTIEVTSAVGEGTRFELRLVLPAADPSEIRVSVPDRGPLSPRPGEPVPPAVAAPEPPATRVLVRPPMRTEDLPGASAIRGRVLIVEDNVVNQRLIVRIVEKLGCDVRVVGDGQQALDTLAHERFDAVLMDCQMPVLDGYDTTRAIRAREALEPPRHLPVIAVTAHATDGDRERCLEAGMDDYLTKPVRADALVTTLTSWLAKPREN